ncbi:hypothetical protein BDN70DRAFT_870376 [Pholiota conissans]|uniref:Uncharacterized protein n=1 Tax=Pholiota conissans TaxID=109636 RepID=A0A9P6D807_9AGAR|nr:hypothetical protein BDN70DRAFT_870376 [Pholiota conissans]
MSSHEDQKPVKLRKSTARADQQPRPPFSIRTPDQLNQPRPQNTLNGYVVPPVYSGRAPVRPALVQKASKVSADRHFTPSRAAAKSASGRSLPRSSLRNEITSSRITTTKAADGRINSTSGSHGFREQVETTIAPTPARNSKSTVELKPLWQQLDDEYHQAILRSQKRDRGGNNIAFTRRIGQRDAAPAARDIDMADANRDRAVLEPGLKLRVNGILHYSSSDEDEPRYKPLRKTTRIMAARKHEFVNASTSESEESSEDKRDSDASSSSSEDEEDQPPTPKSESDVEMDDLAPPPGDIVLLDPPPNASPTPVRDLTATLHTEPPSDLIAAVEALTLSATRMQQTKQLPFLVRNLRRGFLKRCRKLQVPIFTDGRKVSLDLVYDYIAGVSYQTQINAWCCPLCDLLGVVKTQEMLECHLRWDHKEVFCEWQKNSETEQMEHWTLRLLIPEILKEDLEEKPARVIQSIPVTADTPPKRSASAFITPHTRRLMSPFPSVSLSPPTPKSAIQPEYNPLDLLPKIEFKSEPTPTSVPPSSRSTSTFDLSSTASTISRSITHTNSRSTTSQTHTGTSAPPSSSAAATKAPRQAGSGSAERPITPPPPDNLLGPAAQYPYLPAKSDYGGPTVEYTCRPTGPSVFDLLGTLPMEPFGLLDWDIIDREEEIWEDDDLKPEYKVIQALWMRWIMLNRNKFISNYHKGVITFVDEYWKIIHRAAGWDALRYFLFNLLVNHFLDARNMAKILRHYEGLTGMDGWYD